MFKIGEFSKLSRISIRMLRHYDEIGLLVPEHTDPWTGYRQYAAFQLMIANRITALRHMGFSLADTAALLACWEDRSALEQRLLAAGKTELYEEMVRISNLANITYLRQKETKGLGHAISKARSFTGDEPFVVLYGDDVIMGEDPVASQLIRAYETYGKPCVGIKEVTREAIVKYSSLKVDPLRDNLYQVTDMIEKPAPGKEFSLFSILGRCLLTPEIYDILDRTAPGAGGEIQLTDAMAVLARSGGMVGVDFTGKRYDMGSKLGVMQAQVETALRHPEIGADFRAYLKEIAKEL